MYEGRVYDITFYARFHPGAGKIYKGAGKDCTKLFKKYHAWVDAQSIIGKD